MICTSKRDWRHFQEHSPICPRGEHIEVRTSVFSHQKWNYLPHRFSFEGKWHVACFDIGAQITAFAVKQAKEHCKHMRTAFRSRENKNKYRVGETSQPYLCSIMNIIPVLHNLVITTNIDVMNTNVVIMIGLGLQEKHKFFVDNAKNLKSFSNLILNVPLVGKRSHTYLISDSDVACFWKTKNLSSYTEMFLILGQTSYEIFFNVRNL